MNYDCFIKFSRQVSITFINKISFARAMLDTIKKLWSIVKSILEPITNTINAVINLILSALVYFIGIASVSIAMKLSGRHFLELKKQNKKSNWHEHKVTKEPIEKYYRTF